MSYKVVAVLEARYVWVSVRKRTSNETVVGTTSRK